MEDLELFAWQHQMVSFKKIDNVCLMGAYKNASESPSFTQERS